MRSCRPICSNLAPRTQSSTTFWEEFERIRLRLKNWTPQPCWRARCLRSQQRACQDGGNSPWLIPSSSDERKAAAIAGARHNGEIAMEPAPGAEEATQSWARLCNDRRLEFGVEIAALAVLAILCVLIIKPFVTAALWFFKQGATAWGVFMLAWGIVAIGGVAWTRRRSRY